MVTCIFYNVFGWTSVKTVEKYDKIILDFPDEKVYYNSNIIFRRDAR